MRGSPGRVQLALLCSVEQLCGRLAWCGRLPSWQWQLAGMLLEAQGPQAQPLPAAPRRWVTVTGFSSTGDRQQLGSVKKSCLSLQGGRVWEVGTPAPGLCVPL